MARSIITLTTDFGLADYYVGVVKGAILSVNPDVQVVDICHAVKPFDVMEGAFAIADAYRSFPPWTIHIVVVDPGVGSARRPILVSVDKYKFVAPDNGVLSMIYEREERLRVRHITAAHYFLQPISNTFHARDIFGPVAGWLSKQVDEEKFGDIVTDFVRLPLPQTRKVNERLLKGVVIRVDRFGTLITNLTPTDVPQILGRESGSFKIVVGKSEITQLRSSYSEGADGELFAILGSSGRLEIAANRSSAAEALGAGKGTEVGVVFP